jgi:AraC family transcriptional activator of mtrCDE
VVVCGYFRTSYAASIDLFASLISPIVEQFSDADELARNFISAMAELTAEKVGMRAMTTAILKRILVMVLRQFLSSPDSQVERFTMLNDPQVARAFAEMASNPGASHSVQSLSRIAGLSRSVFMARFTRAYGASPMAILRKLRMRQAASLLEKNVLSIERVARSVGYESRSSFFRAFREAFGTDPSEYAKQLSERQRLPRISDERSSQEEVG